MKMWTWIIVGFFGWCIISSYFAYDFMLEAKPSQFLNNHLSVENKSQTDTIKVDGVEYLVVETNNGVGVTFKLNKSNLRKLAEMVSELSDEMDSEKFNNIIQGK
tara:strand:+ start:756 stop:1067 length:312 start_codon:yes stop_codon:yes gene_type:complete